MAASVGWHGVVTHRHAHPSALASERTCLLVEEEYSVSSLWKRNPQLKKQENGYNQDEETQQDDEHDCANINELSELFSSVEQERSHEDIDLQVLLEGEHALNVEDVSDIFSELEDTSSEGSTHTEDDATNVDELAALFSAIDEHDLVKCEASVSDPLDASNVESLSELFSELEKQEQDQLNQDWIASLDVDDVSGLFTELEQSEHPPVPSNKAAAQVDSRVFVPNFSVRIEGQKCVTGPILRVSPQQVGGLLAGPPGLRPCGPVARPPPMSVGKRKDCAPTVSMPRVSDPSISETRRASAAKRRRVNGRFVREQNAFVAITSLQE